jgi:hypothetical protein
MRWRSTCCSTRCHTDAYQSLVLTPWCLVPQLDSKDQGPRTKDFFSHLAGSLFSGSCFSGAGSGAGAGGGDSFISVGGGVRRGCAGGRGKGRGTGCALGGGIMPAGGTMRPGGGDGGAEGSKVGADGGAAGDAG